jgi:fibronectin type 3 domain-containing protein
MFVPSPVRTLIARALCLLVILAGLSGQARAFIHPCIPATTQDLDYIKANLDQEPWKTGYAKLLATWNPNRVPQPYATVTRNPNLNLGAWSGDMGAVYDYARLWYFTGNHAHAQKARDILIAWANTQTTMGGNEAGLALGDLAMAYGGGASILRGTWPGWTEADTTAVKKLFLNVYWPRIAPAGNLQGPANKGSLNMMSGMAIALFCDDTAKFDHVLNLYRTYPGSGLPNTLPTGQMGETGRDAGHAYGDLLGKAFIAECAWKQGIDLFSEWDNRLLAVGEYYCRNIFETDNPFVHYGTVDYLYTENAEGPYGANRAALYIIQNAYKNRKGLPTPWIDRKLPEQWLDTYNWMYARTADFSTATPPAPIVRPEVSLASGGLTLTTLGNNSTGRSVSYDNGVWTMTGAGADVWGDTNDDCQFAYKQMDGDCAIVARVTSAQSINGATKAGVMIRDNLSAAVSQRGFTSVIPNTPTQVQSRLKGDTERWAGRVSQTTTLPDPGMPYWVKIERRGFLLTSYTSQDGTSWSPNVSNYFANLPSTLYIGLFIASGSATTTTTATFDHVAFTDGTGGLVTTPAAPAGLLASGSSKAITLRWLPSFGATAYDVLRSTTAGGGYTLIASDLPADKPSYMDTTPAPGTTYYYVVQAKNSAGTSGNSPEFYGSLLSGAMVNIAFGGTPTASFNQDSTIEGANQAFNSDGGSKWYGYNSPANWLQYDFGAGNAQVVKRYTINVADVAARDPKDWTFLGSQDGSTWTTLDTRSNQTFPNRLRNIYDLGNTTAYRYYRLDITSSNGAGGVAVGDLGLWSDTGRIIPDSTYCLVSSNANKVMDVTSDADGAQAVQQTFAGDDTQQWTLAWQGNGVYRATNVAASKVLDNGGSSDAGANLVIQPSSGATSQLWTLAPDGDGFFRVTSANSGLVADVAGGSTTDGASIVQSAYSGADSQQWRIAIAVAPLPPPPAPTGLAASAVSISQIHLTWTASPDAISYTIKRATVSGGPYTTVAESVNIPSYSDTGLFSSTTYYYVVSAVNGGGESADSAEAGAMTLSAPPAAPTGLTATLGQNQVTLNWTAPPAATSYTVKRSTTSGGPYTTVAESVTDATYTDTGLSNGVTYYYVVSAANINGSGPDSAEVSATPSNVVVHLKFDESGGALATDVSGRANHATLLGSPTFSPGVFGNTLNLPATAAQYARLPSGVTGGLTDFTVSTWIKVNAFANWQRIFDFGSGTTNYMFLTTQYAGSAAKLRFGIRTPSVAEQTVSGNAIALVADAWTHLAVVRSGTTVSLYVNGSLAGSGTIALNPANLGVTTQNYLGKSQWPDPYLNAALDDFRLYSHAMSASEIAAFAQPAAGAPMQLTAAPGDGQTTLAWLPNATTTYAVKRSTTSGGPYSTVAEGLTALTYTDTGLTNGLTYYYVVSGANAQGPGPDSAEVSATPSSLGLHLKFDESGGTVAADSSGRARHATLVNAPTFGVGKLDNALNFPATTSQYATLPSGVVSGLTDFTVSTWIKVNAFATWQRIFDFGSATNNYMFLTTQYTPTAPNNAKLRFAIRTATVAEQSVSGTIALVADVWTHVAVTRTGTTVRLYVNGALAGSGTIALNPSDLGTTTLNYLGKSQFNDPYLNAALDDFRLYSQALSASEIALYASPLAAPQNLAAAPGPLSLDLSWSAVPNATSYTVKYSTTSGGPYTTLSAGLPSTTQLHSGLNHGTTYYYVVSAANSVYESPASAELAAMPESALLNEAEAATPAFAIIPASEGNPATARLTTASSVAGHSYQLQTSTDLATGSWQNVGEPVLGDGAQIVFETPYDPAEPRRFYRILISR